MKDSRGPVTVGPGYSQCTWPHRPDRTPSFAFESLERQPPASPADNQPGTRHSRREIAGLAAVALAGAFGLVRLAYHVTGPKREPNVDMTIRYEVVSLWLHPALYELAQHPSEFAGCWSQEAFRRYAKDRGLEKAWYVITVKVIQLSGQNVVSSTIRRPYDMMTACYSEFPDVLATADGNPPSYPLTDFATAKVGIIPDCFLDADPRAVLNELRMLEHLPGQGAAP
jgi:hypothetical protein